MGTDNELKLGAWIRTRRFLTYGSIEGGTTMASVVRQNYHAECEENVNTLKHHKLTSYYTFLAMSQHFDRDDISLPGFSKFFKNRSDTKRDFAEKLMKYQNSRGGRIVFKDVTKPAQNEWRSPLQALEIAMEQEKMMNDFCITMTHTAEKHGDDHLADFMEDEFLAAQVNAIKDLSDKITQLKRAGEGLGEYVLDRELE